MKKIYMINYDLNKAGQDYPDLISEIKRSPDWIKYLKSGWFVATTETATQLYERLRKWTDANDLILVNEFTKNNNGWLKRDVWDWLNRY